MLRNHCIRAADLRLVFIRHLFEGVDDLRQSAVFTAVFVWQAAMRESRFLAAGDDEKNGR